MFPDLCNYFSKYKHNKQGWWPDLDRQVVINSIHKFTGKIKNSAKESIGWKYCNTIGALTAHVKNVFLIFKL